MSLGRIAKLFAAQNVGQLVTILTQLLLPPIFIHAYGLNLYGQWLAVSAAVGYLSTFNYGLQTYTNMQMTIHYNRGELDECREVQSAGLRILLCTLGGIGIVLLVIFAIPLDSLLHLTIPERTAQWTLYLLGAQIVASMLFGFFSGSYMVVGATHRGTNFSNLNQLVTTGATACLAVFHRSFLWIAAAQLGIMLFAALLLVVDFGRIAPDIRPTLKYWKRGSLGAILKPSAHYALLYSSNILAYQLPILLMQRILGPATVVIYSVTRTIYSMSRRILYLVTNSLGPEVTITFGQKNWQKLLRLYELSERVVLLLVPPITFGSMLFTPVLLQLWLHKGNLYDPSVCLLMGITVSVLSIKEHKYQFQFSSNQVRDVSYMVPLAYGATLLLAIPAMRYAGLQGYLGVWCISEIAQLVYLVHLNQRLFGQEANLDRKPLYLLFGFLVLGTLSTTWLVYHIRDFAAYLQIAIATSVSIAMLIGSYFVFRVDEIRSLLWDRLKHRFPALASL
jgi:O-antigen/teichoic acid export membrane protein